MALLLLSGCNQLGPSAIRNGRSLYNDSIIDSGDQQTLAAITRLRYGETMGMLAVSSVTANIRVRVGASADSKAWGTNTQVDGNLVPLSTNIAYEENPTISYTPIDGAQYVRELLSPLPIDLTFLLLGAAPDKKRCATALIESINGIPNPTFASVPEQRDERFERMVDLLVRLETGEACKWARTTGEAPGYAVVISRYAPDHTTDVKELLELLGVPGDAAAAGQDVILPVWLSDGTTDKRGGMAIETRSIFDLLKIACASMEVPPEHLEAGWVRTYPPLGSVKDLIRIRCSADAPEAAMVAVERHGWWFYIDAADPGSKEFFRILQTLFSVRIAESVKTASQLPVLTVPVSR